MSSADRFAALKQIVQNRRATLDLQVQEQTQIETELASAQTEAEQERVAYGEAKKDEGFKLGMEQNTKPGDKVFSQEDFDAKVDEKVQPVLADNAKLKAEATASASQIAALQTMVSELQAQSGMTAVLVAKAEAKVRADIAKKIRDTKVDDDALLSELDKGSVFDPGPSTGESSGEVSVDPGAGSTEGDSSVGAGETVDAGGSSEASGDAPEQAESKGLRKKK